MARGETIQTKIHYKGTDEDFVVFVDDPEDYKKWLKDSSVPLSHFVSTFQVFTNHKQGVQGTLNTASKGTLENEFGTTSEDDVIKEILTKGIMQESEAPERLGFRNESQGARTAH